MVSYDSGNSNPRFRNIGKPDLDTLMALIPFLLFMIAYASSSSGQTYITMFSSFIGVYYTGYRVSESFIRGYVIPEAPSYEEDATDESDNTGSTDEMSDQAKRDLKALNQLNEFANKIKEANIARRDAASQDDELPPLVPLNDLLLYKNNDGPHLRQRGQFAPSMDEGIAI
jgi:hypothetical protein